MTGPIREMIFKNASFMKALDKAVDSSSESVTFDGKKWHMGTTEMQWSSEKLNFFQASFSKISHRLHAFFSRTYAKRFDHTVKLFEKAFEHDQETKNSALKSHGLMVQTANTDQAVQQLTSQLADLSKQLQTAPEELQNANSALVTAQEQLIANQEEQERVRIAISQLNEKFASQAQAFLNIKNEDLVALQSPLDQLFKAEVSLHKEIEQARERLERLAIQYERELAPLKQQKQTVAQQLELAKAQLAELRPIEKKEAVIEPLVQQIAVDEPKAPFAFNAATLQFLEAVGRSAPELRQIFESMFMNISLKYGDNIIESCSLSPNGKGVLTFKEKIHFWMPTTNAEGELDPHVEPVGGAIFTYGDEKRQMHFALNNDSLEVKKGWDVKARIPSGFDFLKGLVGAWPEAHVLKISANEGTVTITGGKKVMGFLREKKTVRPLEKSKINWLNNGEILPLTPQTSLKESLEGYLSQKYKE